MPAPERQPQIQLVNAIPATTALVLSAALASSAPTPTRKLPTHAAVALPTQHRAAHAMQATIKLLLFPATRTKFSAPLVNLATHMRLRIHHALGQPPATQ